MIRRTSIVLVIDVLVLTCIFLAKISMSQGAGYGNLQICIVGAGIGGASAAHFLSQSTDSKGGPLRIIIFEKKGSVGGRIATTQFNGGGSAEAGASIMASKNRLMSHFVEFLNLTRVPLGGNRTFGLWDGKQYRLVTSRRPTVTAAKFLTRYGRSVFEMRKLVNDLLDRYDNLYPSRFAINQWQASETVKSLFAPTRGLYDLTQMRFDTLVKGKFSDLFLNEMASAISRANYNQEASEMNALAGAVSLAGSGGTLWRVKEGNVQVVHGLIERSGAELVLNTEIKAIVNSTENGAILHYILNSKSGMSWQCNGVIIAAPLELTTVSLPDSLSHSPLHGRKFQTTVASFVEGAVNKRTFGRWAPDGTLTTAGSENDFSLCNIVHKIDKQTAIYKVFSKKLLSSDVIERLFEPGAKISSIHSWKAYPKFSPPERFARFALDDDGALYYTSPIESAGSAMEMSAISGANAASLIFKKLKLRRRNEGDRNKDEL